MSATRKPPAGLSLDLDNAWSYLRNHGDAAWADYPSFLALAVPRMLDFLAAKGLTITVFVVGRDAAREPDWIARIAAAGHEIGNHTFDHPSGFHRLAAAEVAAQIGDTDAVLARVAGLRPRGFRGPSYALSAAVLAELAGRGYAYDASTFPTVVGPLARAYHLATSRLDAAEKARQKALFGGWRSGVQPLNPYHWTLPGGGRLAEIPVTTLPFLRLPIHTTYLHFLAGMAPGLARAYAGLATALCRWTATRPSLLLHAADFVGVEDQTGLDFLPGMKTPLADKLALTAAMIDRAGAAFDLLPLGRFVEAVAAEAALPERPPSFAEPGGAR